MIENANVAFVGSGTMGEAMTRVTLAKGLLTTQQIIASDVRPDRLEALAARYGIRVTTDNATAVHDADVVVLSVKPQVLPTVLVELKGKVQPTAVVLSIVAGARLATLVEGLGHGAVVRSMPNTPAQIGEGMTVWTASVEVSPGQKEIAQSIWGALGREIYVGDEKYIDMATAISGSGPAYVFLLIEALIDAAVHIGWPEETAGELVLQTVLGSTRLIQATGKHPTELRKMVTSPGGTTAEGVHELEEGGVRALLARAVVAAHERAKVLGGE